MASPGLRSILDAMVRPLRRSSRPTTCTRSPDDPHRRTDGLHTGDRSGARQPHRLSPRGPRAAGDDLRHPRPAEVEGALGRPDRRGGRDPRGGPLLRDASPPRRARGDRGRRLRPLPHHVDRLHRDRPLRGHGALGSLRGPARDLPAHLRRPADPGDHHRLLLRRAPRGPRRLRRPRRHHRRHAHGGGLRPLRAATVVLLANTAPVAFGAIAIPILTAGNLTGIPYEEIGAYVGHQAPIIAIFVPLLLVFMVDGRRGSARPGRPPSSSASPSPSPSGSRRRGSRSR